AGLTTIHVTHDQTEAAMLADRIAVMIGGRIRQTGTPEEIFNSPADAEIAEFVGTENILEGIVVSNEGGLATIEVGVHVVEAVSGYSAGEHVRVCLRPEDVFVSVGAVASEIERGDRDHRESSVRNAFHGTVTQMMPYGALTRVKIDCEVVVVALITKQSTAAMGLTAGSSVCVSFKAAAVHVIR
ncbi:MAG TPA: TOBE domain-containing protein, partial [Methanosarcinales archaeon]|nr:TOBE domain-containing protein [Methanosarcinales archaeon]